jgi:hypothetical protein
VSSVAGSAASGRDSAGATVEIRVGRRPTVGRDRLADRHVVGDAVLVLVGGVAGDEVHFHAGAPPWLDQDGGASCRDGAARDRALDQDPAHGGGRDIEANQYGGHRIRAHRQQAVLGHAAITEQKMVLAQEPAEQQVVRCRRARPVHDDHLHLGGILATADGRAREEKPHQGRPHAALRPHPPSPRSGFHRCCFSERRAW